MVRLITNPSSGSYSMSLFSKNFFNSSLIGILKTASITALSSLCLMTSAFARSPSNNEIESIIIDLPAQFHQLKLSFYRQNQDLTTR